MESPRRHPAARRWAIAVIAALGLIGVYQIAWAATVDNIVPTRTYGSPCYTGSVNGGYLCQTDNSDVYYYMDSSGDFMLEAGDKENVKNTLGIEFSPTHLAIHLDTSPVFSGSGETDIVYQEGSVPGSDTGITWCDDPTSGYQCDQQYVRIEGGGQYLYGLICHETGHAVGLTHGAQAYPVVSNTNSVLGCMRKPTDSTWGLGTNQRDNINAVYPAP